MTEGYLEIGGQAIISKARCRLSGRFVAVKKFLNKSTKIEIENALKEGYLLQKLKHRNIVKCLEVFKPTQYDSQVYIVMELMDCSLSTYI